MNPNSLIKDNELRNLIRSDKALEWVESLMIRFHDSKENLEFIRLKNGVTQELLDELLPLGIYAKNNYNKPNIFLKYYPGSVTSYDADFIDQNGDLIERVEVTMAINGQQSRIQAEAINKYGHSSVYHTPEYSGKSKKRKIKKSDVVTIESDSIVELYVERIQEAYVKKHENLNKYPETTLLIGVDIPLFMESKYQAIIESFKILENTFNSIKCVNTSSNHYWCLK
jgi:hypothetical protein